MDYNLDKELPNQKEKLWIVLVDWFRGIRMYADIEMTNKNNDYFHTELDDNKVDLIYKVSLGEKAKIKKIKFIGNKVFKDKKLKSIITSEEYKFWKFISGKKFLNENLIKFDERLLKNFYLNQGYYDVTISSSFAKLIEDYDFELIYNIPSLTWTVSFGSATNLLI